MELGTTGEGRKEFTSSKRWGRKKPGDVRFYRESNGRISVTGNPNPYDVAEAIRRSKENPIGPEKAAQVRDRMRARLQERAR